jgi:predicted amidohydrolase YtcJ
VAGTESEKAPAGTWITGSDWDHTLWGGEPPRRNWIDAVTPNHPVWINRLDGHMALANSAALRAAGVTRDTPAIEGGEIVRNAKGEPTGLLKDNAMSLVEQEVPPPSTAQKDAALAAAMQHVAAHYGGSAATGSSRRRRRSKASRSSRRWRRGASPMIAAAPPRRCASRCRRPVAAARARRGRCRPTSPCCGPSSRHRHPGGWVPEQKITVEEALAAYTRAAAYASFEERDKGMIAPGMLGDVTVIDRDLRRIPPADIRNARIVYTIVGGRVMFRGDPPSRPR